MLVLLCAGAGGGEAAVRAATAIELVHMATLVHDDVLDDAPLRRGLPTVAATSGRDRARSPPATCSSPAPSPCSPSAGDARAVALLADASVALARGELAQRHDAFDTRHLRAALPRPLPAEDRDACSSAPACSAATPSACGEFGAEIGLAFQLLDDVLDVSGPPSAPARRAAPTCSTAPSPCR